MSGSTDKILQALEAEQIRRLNLTKEDLQKSYRKLAEQNFTTFFIILPLTLLHLIAVSQKRSIIENLTFILLKKEDFCKYFFDFIENIMIYSSIAALPPVTVYM